MTRRRLVIDSNDPGQFLLLVEGGAVTIGNSRKHNDAVLEHLRVVRIHCELEVEGEHVTLTNGAPHELGLGEVVQSGGSQFQLQAVPDRPGEETERILEDAPAEAVKADVSPEQAHLRQRLLVIDGADQGRSFPLPESGTVTPGQDRNHVSAAHIDVAPIRDDPHEHPAQGEDESAPSSTSAAIPPEAPPQAVRLLDVLRDKLVRLSGHTFGHYRLGAVLGRGRFGVVFQADHLETGQVVGLKVFSPLFPQSEQELIRFARVMKGLLPLRHPHLLTVTGAGKIGTYTWVAREYIKGESLSELIRRLGTGRRLDWRIGCRVAVQIGRALDFASKHQLRHGKITPANILLQRSDKATKLADLMLGAALEGSRLWQASLAHRPVSELAYLSPEQAAPNALVNDLSDLYSLGAVVYTLLTGRPPFHGDTSDELLQQIQGPDAPAPPGTLNAAVPAPLEKVVLKMLAKRQEDRYQTPAELLAEIEPIEAAVVNGV